MTMKDPNEGGRVKIIVITINEELGIARQTLAVIGKVKGDGISHIVLSLSGDIRGAGIAEGSSHKIFIGE